VNDNHLRGAALEAAAERWLTARGLHCVARNFRCKGGEIDLVMREGTQLAFVEVRFRSSDRYGSAAESVTAAKQRRLVQAAHLFIEAHPQWRHCNCRFDVLAGRPAAAGAIEWEWLRDAFGA
jgi:putative endonuclease